MNSIVRTSITNANDFYFAGKTKSLSDGVTNKTFISEVGFIMKAITSNQDESCFTFPSGYALSLQNISTIPLEIINNSSWNFGINL